MSLCIDVQNLTKTYGDHVVIQDLSLTIQEREIVIFQGSSGIGKSTFLRCLTYLEPFQGGHVRVGTLDLHAGMNERHHHQTIRAMREQLGFVFQFFNLFPHLTVMQNLMIGPMKVLGKSEEEARSTAQQYLKRVGLEAKANRYPQALSGGQQQRVGIARALAMHPKAILFDEPTSSLDPEMKAEIVSVIEDFAKEKLTLLIVTHEPAFAERIATRVVTLGPRCKILSDKSL